MIAPAPMKPIPVTICAAIRVGSARTTFPPFVRNSWKPYAETIVNNAEPSETSRCVRKPASRSRSSRSMPTAPPSAAASASRSSASSQFRTGRLDASNRNGVLLRRGDLLDAERRELEQLVQLFPRERRSLCGRLHLDERAVARDDDVHIHVRHRVLGVVEVEQARPVDYADRHGGDGAGQR